MILDLVIDRVIVRGAASRDLRAPELRVMIERAITEAVSSRALSEHRSAHAAVEVNAGRLTNGTAVAAAVGQGVILALGGGGARG